MSRISLAFRTNNEDYLENFEATDAEAAPTARQPRFGLMVIGALALAVLLGVGLALLH